MESTIGLEWVGRAALERMAMGEFFSDGARRFFRSRICSDAWRGAGSPLVYFATSEQCGRDARRGTVRVLDMTDGSVDTVGTFQEYVSIGSANRAAKRLALASATLRAEGGAR